MSFTSLLASLPMILSAIICFGLIVFMHELGHFSVALLCKIPVEEFAMGMGPLLYTRVGASGIRYSLRLLPIGAFVRLVGEESEDETERASYLQAPVAKRIAMTFAGPFFNFVLAVLLFTGICIFTGLPSDKPIVGEVRPGSPAESAGLLPNDYFQSINARPVATWNDAVALINAAPEEEIIVELNRSGAPLSVKVVPERTPEDGKGRIGISVALERFAVTASVQRGVQNTVGAVLLFFSSIADAIGQQQAPELVGPIGIIQVTGEVAKNGFADLLWFMAFISINLGVVNLLPVPPLDGARIVLMFIEAVRGRPLPPEREGMLHFVGYVFLLGLIALVTFGDILRIFRG